MEGTLIKKEDKWEIVNVQATLNGPFLQSIPLLQESFDVNLQMEKVVELKEGKAIKFELVDDWDLPADKDNMIIKQYAKIVN